MRVRMTLGRRWIVLTPLLLLACTTSTDPFTLFGVSGTITQGGEPATARMTLNAGNFSTSQDFTGTYSITVGGGGVPASDCGATAIRAQLLATDGTVVDEETRALGSCGEHVVDFEFP